MLQKGFLKPKKDPKNARAIKRSRIFFIVGVVVMLAALIWMMSLRTGESFSSQILSVKIAGIAMITGIVLALVGWWMNFFAQNKNRR